MSFPPNISDQALAACARRCCICKDWSGTRMQLHHITPQSEGGPDSFDNCIPLCLNCHEEVGSYNSKHPIGRKFSNDELKLHRDRWFEFVKNNPERLGDSTGAFFRSLNAEEIRASVELHYHEVGLWIPNEGIVNTEVFAAKVRNQGAKSIYVDTIGFMAEERQYRGTFFPYSGDEKAREIGIGRFEVFSFYGVDLPPEDIGKLDGLYMITGTGHIFVNRCSLARFIKDCQEKPPQEIGPSTTA